ncbi:MAG TPA: SH3 domain-containing protein, partial [Vicinamibacteria bacterium]|nr:SH3 domain-containing protein [Vicinamibacteria bacterium]
TRARRSEEEQRRLEEQIALRLRELQVTETELIRTKARLKGLETRAEASSAIAEARILVKRVESKGRSATLKAAEEDLEKAEGLLQEENYGAALFFALKAQDMVTKASDNRAAADGAESDRPAPQATYVVAVDSANIRQSPSTQAPVLAEVKRGMTLRALAVRGTWVKVAHDAVTGWVSLRLLE